MNLINCTLVFTFIFAMSSFASGNPFDNFPVLNGVEDLPQVDTKSQSIPAIGQLETRYMGDSLMLQRFGYDEICIKTKFDHTEKIFGGTLVFIKNGGVLCPSSGGFLPLDHDNTDYPQRLRVPLYLKKKKSHYQLKLGARKLKRKITEEELNTSFEYVTRHHIAEDSLQQQIEYVGKSGSVLKFVYSEFRDQRIRDAFTREFQVDLSEGNIVAFKGAVFEVNKASNTSITYTVKRHFKEF
jgi:hypothetical protein